MSDSQQEPDGPLSIAENAATAGVATLAADLILMAGGIPSPLAAAATVAIGTAAVDSLRRWRLARIGTCVQTALDASGLTDVELSERVASDEDLALLTERVMYGAADGFDERVLALGLTLASGLSDSAKVDLEMIVARCLGELDRPHVEVLRFMIDDVIDHYHLLGHFRAISRESLRRPTVAYGEPPFPDAVLDDAIAVMTRLGMLETEASYRPRRNDVLGRPQDPEIGVQYSVTKLGKLVVDRLLEAGEVAARRRDFPQS